MSMITAVSAVPAPISAPLQLSLDAVASPRPDASSLPFADILSEGLRNVDSKIGTADALVRSFALGDDVPIHQVTMALEEARLAVEIAMQVRGRLVETYRDFMQMQI